MIISIVDDKNLGKIKEEVIIQSAEHLIETVCSNTWSSIRFKDGKRSAKNFESTIFIGLDIDEKITWREAELRLRNRDLKFIIGASKSHQKEKNGVTCDRFRVLLFFNRLITSGEEYQKIWKWINREIFFELDQQTKDCARMFFPCKSIITSDIYSHGKIDVDKILSEPTNEVKEEKPKRKIYKPNDGEKGLLSKRTQTFLNGEYEDGSWNKEYIYACKDLKGQGYDIDSAQKMLKSVTGLLDSTDLMLLDYSYRTHTFEVDFRPNLKEKKKKNKLKKLFSKLRKL